MHSGVVKHGDTHSITLCVNADLTGATDLKIFAKKRDEVIELTGDFGDRATGKITHQLTGELEVGRYAIEVEFKDVEGLVHTAPSEGYTELWVYADLG